MNKNTSIQPMVEVNNVGIRFKLPNQKISGLKEYIVKSIKKEIVYNEFWAVRDASFRINKGDVFGVLGLNGAGKSTILKLIAGVLKPTTGRVIINGTMAPLIELGAGFDQELTARENVFLNAAILGYKDNYTKTIFDEIVEFSELNDFMDTPIKNFSSGMYARLGFAIATAVVPDILIVDEILSVGDFRFQEKCERKIHEMIEKGTTVIIVSHSIEQIKQVCNRGIIMEKGRIIKEGDIQEVCNYYYTRY